MRALVIAAVLALPAAAAADEPVAAPPRADLPPSLYLLDLRGGPSQAIARVHVVTDAATATVIDLGGVLRSSGGYALRVRVPVLTGRPPRDADQDRWSGLGVLTVGLTRSWTLNDTGGEQRLGLGVVASLPTSTIPEGSTAQELGRQLGELAKARSPGEIFGDVAGRLELGWQWRGCAVAYQANLRVGFATLPDGYFQDEAYAYVGVGLGAAIALGPVELLLEAQMAHDSRIAEGLLPVDAHPSPQPLSRAADVGLRLRALPQVTAGVSATLAYHETFVGGWLRVAADLPFGGSR